MRGLALALPLAALLTGYGLSIVFAQEGVAGQEGVAAQEGTTIVGTVRNGTAEAPFDPTSIRVTLNILEGIVAIDQRTVMPTADGRFAFADVPVGTGRVYFIGAEYQGAVYSASLQLPDLPLPVNIEVFAATTSTDVLAIESHAVIITGADADGRIVEVLERASVRNDSGYTLVPDFEVEGPAMLSFLRFALPSNATHLDVRSNLVGGDVLEVDRGFALSIPVPPTGEGVHQFEFIYRLSYQGDSLDLSRTMRFGAESFRYVVPEGAGIGVSADLNDLGSTRFEGRSLQLLEVANIPRGQVLDLRLVALPQPTIWSRIASRGGDWYVRYVVPGAVIAALAVLAVSGLRRRSLARVAAGPGARVALLDRVDALEARRASMSPRRYEAERVLLKRALVDLDVSARFPDDPDA